MFLRGRLPLLLLQKKWDKVCESEKKIPWSKLIGCFLYSFSFLPFEMSESGRSKKKEQRVFFYGAFFFLDSTSEIENLWKKPACVVNLILTFEFYKVFVSYCWYFQFNLPLSQSNGNVLWVSLIQPEVYVFSEPEKNVFNFHFIIGIRSVCMHKRNNNKIEIVLVT